MPYHTTLRLLRQRGACADGVRRLQSFLGKNATEDFPVNLNDYLTISTVKDVAFALGATLEDSTLASRLIAAEFAYSTLSIFKRGYPYDNRPVEALNCSVLYCFDLQDTKTLQDKTQACKMAMLGVVHLSPKDPEYAPSALVAARRHSVCSALWASMGCVSYVFWAAVHSNKSVFWEEGCPFSATADERNAAVARNIQEQERILRKYLS